MLGLQGIVVKCTAAIVFSYGGLFLRILTARHVMHELARQVVQQTMIGQMAIATALIGFNDLGRSVTPIFLLMDHFLYRFSTFSEKMKKIYRKEVRSFCKMHHRIPFFLALRLSVGWS